MATKKPSKPVKKPARPPPKAPAKKAPVKKKVPPKKVVEEEDIPKDEVPTHPPEEEADGTDVELPPITDSETGEVPPEVPPEAPKEPEKEKIDKEKLLGFIEDIIDTLSFKRVGLVAMLVIIGIVLYSVYENRAAILERFTGPRVVVQEPVITEWTLSNTSKANLQALARTTDVSFIAVSDVDLQKNRRTVRYYYIDDPEIKPTQAALNALSLPQALFDYDAKNTAQMVAVLSNEFRCDPFIETVYFRYAPELVEQLPTICRIAIPPFAGTFVGFITVATGKVMTRAELETIRLEVSRLAVEIYLNDVTKRPGAMVPNR